MPSVVCRQRRRRRLMPVARRALRWRTSRQGRSAIARRCRLLVPASVVARRVCRPVRRRADPGRGSPLRGAGRRWATRRMSAQGISGLPMDRGARRCTSLADGAMRVAVGILGFSFGSNGLSAHSETCSWCFGSRYGGALGSFGARGSYFRPTSRSGFTGCPVIGNDRLRSV